MGCGLQQQQQQQQQSSKHKQNLKELAPQKWVVMGGALDKGIQREKEIEKASSGYYTVFRLEWGLLICYCMVG